MAHILLTAMPFAGHVRPMTAVAAALLERGHRVTAYTGARYADAFDQLGCAILPWSAAQDFDETRLSDTFPEAGGPGPLGLVAKVRDVFIGTARGQVDDMCAAHAATPFDAIVADVMAVGAGLTAEVLELPWVTISVVPLTMPSRDLPPSGSTLMPGRGRLGEARDALLRRAAPSMTAPLDGPHRAVRASLGLGPGRRFDSTLYSPTLVIATGAPSVELPRTDLPASVHFVGRLVPPTAARPTPSWVAPLLHEAPVVVFVTQGTHDTDLNALLVPTLEGLADEPVRVVATTAGRDLAVEPPPNARLVDFVPFAAIVPGCDVGVTNGGWGGVLDMLSMGVPLVIAGGTLDKPQIAAQVARAGAGIDLRTGRPTPAQVRDAVRRVRSDPRFKQRAVEIAAELARLGGARHAVELIERLVLSGGRGTPPEPSRDRPPPEEVPPEEEDVIVAERTLLPSG